MIRNITALLMLCSFYATSALAVNSPAIENDFGAWLPVSVRLPVYKKVQAYFEVQPRWQRNHVRPLSECLIRTGLGYQFNRRWTAYAGYYWSARFDAKVNNEHRLWQQITSSRRHEQCEIISRFRAEETWRGQFAGPSVRVRNQLRLNYNLGKTPWYLLASEEPIINLNTPERGPKAGFAQNRILLGVGRKVNRFMRIEVSYLNQYRDSKTSSPDIMNHALVSQISFDFTNIRRDKPATKMAGVHTEAPLLACAPQVVYRGLNEPTMLLLGNSQLKPNQFHPSLNNIASHRHSTI